MAKQGVIFLATPVEISGEFTATVESEPDLTGYGLAADADFAIVRWYQGHSTDDTIYFWKPGQTKPTIDRTTQYEEIGWLMTPAVDGKIGGYRQSTYHKFFLYGYGYGGTWKDNPPDITPTFLRTFWYPKEVDTEAPSGIAIMIEAQLLATHGGWRPNGSSQDIHMTNWHCHGFTKLAGGSYEERKEYYYESNTSIYINSATRYLAQVFTASADYTCTKLYINIFKEGSPGDLTVELQGTTGGHPDNSALASKTIPEASISGLWVEIDLGVGAALTNGTKYAIVLKAPGATATDKVHWYEDTTSPSYPGGEIWWDNDAGDSWSSAVADAKFEVWGEKTPGHNQICELYRAVTTATFKYFITGFFVSGELTLPSDLQQVSLTGTGWITGDVSSWITAGDKLGIFVVKKDSSLRDWGMRKVGSSDTQTGTGATLSLGMVELDANGQFECYRDTTGVDFYFVGSMGGGIPAGFGGNTPDFLVKNAMI